MADTPPHGDRSSGVVGPRGAAVAPLPSLASTAAAHGRVEAMDRGTGTHRGRPRGGVRLAWVLLCAAFGAGLLVNAVLYPPFRAPDERAHIDMSRYLAERMSSGAGVAYPADDERWLGEPVREAARATGHGADATVGTPLRAEDAPPRGARPSFGELAAEVPSGARNQMTQHPPAYYALTGALSVWLEGATTASAHLEVVLLRLLGGLLLVALPYLSAVAALRLGVDDVGATVAALVPLAIPMLGHIGASVNNDVLVTALGAGLTPLLLAVGTARGALARAAAVGTLAGAALLTKGFGLVFLLWIAAAYGLTAWRQRRAEVAAHGAAALVLAVAVGGWWWVRNVLTVGALQPHHQHFPSADPGAAADWWWWIGLAARRFAQRFWYEPDIAAGAGAVWAALALLALLVVAGVGAVRAARRGAGSRAAVAAFPFLSLTAVVLFGAAQLYLRSGAPFGIHGRYAYPGLVGVAALVAAASRGAPLSARHGAVVAATAIAAIWQSWAWVAALRQYWGPEGGSLSDGVTAMLAWSPLPPAVVGLAAVAHWVLLAGAVAVVLVAGRVDARDAVPPADPSVGPG
jgi:hypothetical protein